MQLYSYACYSGGCLRDASALPPGSTLFTIADEKREASFEHFNSVYSMLPMVSSNLPKDFGSEYLLLIDLAYGIDPRGAAVKLAEGRTIDIEQALRSQLGKAFTTSQRQQIHEALDSLMGQMRVTDLIKAIETHDVAGLEKNARSNNEVHSELLAVVYSSTVKLRTTGDFWQVMNGILNADPTSLGYAVQRVTCSRFLRYNHDWSPEIWDSLL